MSATMGSLLEGLPSRGYFTTYAGTTSQTIPLYVCERESHPPAELVVKTDNTNLLIRSLKLKNREESKPACENVVRGKRPAEGPPDALAPSKKPALSSCSAEASGSVPGPARDIRAYMEKDLENMTVDHLKNILKEKRLATKGKKDELIRRLIYYQQRAEKAAQPSTTPDAMRH